MTIEIRLLQPQDGHLLAQVAADVFDDPVDPELTAEFLRDRRHHLAVALDQHLVVGMASALDYVHPDKSTALFINEIGVAPAYRRQGIGRRLLQTLIELGHELKCYEIWVGTEYDNTAAKALYLSAGGQPEPFVMYSFPGVKEEGQR